METIIFPIPAAEKICGSQKIDDSANFRLSKHCLRMPCDDGILMFHTLTGSLFLLESEEKEECYRDELIRNWYLVPDGFDENKYADDTHKIASMFSKPKTGIDSYTILTTTDCNARCFYCYEIGCQRYSMTEETARDVAKYIIDTSSREDIRVNWFGGEPLYNIPVIDIITGILKDNKICFHSTMTSNGFYLTPEVAVRARNDWNLKSVQITIDGTEKIYNQTKAYIDDCGNPFERVIENITGAVKAGIRVFIRLNVNRNNTTDMLEAVDYLGERFKNCDNPKILIAFLRPFAGKVHEFDNAEEELKAFYDLTERISSYGLQREDELKTEFYSNRCMADSETAELIMPDGRIAKCEHFNDEDVVGTIYSSDRDEHLLKAWKERATVKEMPECEDCVLYPRCINLKKCPWSKLGCSDSIRAIQIRKMEEKIMDKYEKWKSEKGENK